MSRGRDVEVSDHLHDHDHGGHEHHHYMFAYEFMNNAFAAAGIVAVVSGIVGYFLVMRGRLSPAMRSPISALPAGRPAPA